jgi:hypothetical protein
VVGDAALLEVTELLGDPRLKELGGALVGRLLWKKCVVAPVVRRRCYRGAESELGWG